MGRSRLPAAIKALISQQSEAEWQKTVLEYARMRGWHAWHDVATNAPRKCGSCGAFRAIPRNAPGFPDLVLVRRPDILFAELKRQDGTVSAEQATWIDDLRACGMRVYVWRPSDWPQVEEVLR